MSFDGDCPKQCRVGRMFCSPDCISQYHQVVVVVDYTDIDGTCRNCGVAL